MNKDYDTLIEAMEDLKKEGYSTDFNLLDNAISSSDMNLVFTPDDFNVKAVFRFEGMSNPSDNSILYAIETRTGVKGLLVDGYGVYAGQNSPALLKKLNLPAYPQQDL